MSILHEQYDKIWESVLRGSRTIDAMHDDILRFMNHMISPFKHVSMSAKQSEEIVTIKEEGSDWQLVLEWVPYHLTTTGGRSDGGQYRLALIFYPSGRGFGRDYDLSQYKIPLGYLAKVRENLPRVLLGMENMIAVRDYGIFCQTIDLLREFDQLDKREPDKS